MSHLHDPDTQPASRRSSWRRRRYRLAASAVAAIAVVGTAAYAIPERPAPAPDARGDLVASPGIPSPGTPSPRGGLATGATPSNGAPTPGATGGSTVRAPVDPAALTVTNTGTLKTDRRTLRVVSARTDLTGQAQLAWAADAGHPVGDARCTQNFRFNAQEQAKERPTMLLCWRTSAAKSVYVVAVDLDRRPSERAAAATIGKVWSELG